MSRLGARRPRGREADQRAPFPRRSHCFGGRHQSRLITGEGGNRLQGLLAARCALFAEQWAEAHREAEACSKDQAQHQSSSSARLTVGAKKSVRSFLLPLRTITKGVESFLPALHLHAWLLLPWLPWICEHNKHTASTVIRLWPSSSWTQNTSRQNKTNTANHIASYKLPDSEGLGSIKKMCYFCVLRMAA